MQKIQRFLKGMQRDNNPLDLDNQSYVFMENGDIVDQGGEAFDSIANIRGNEQLDVAWASDVDTNVFPYNQDPKAPYGSNWKIVGSVIVRDDIVLFYANSGSGEDSRIDLLKYNDGSYIRINLVELDLNFQYNKILYGVGYSRTANNFTVYFAEKSTETLDVEVMRFINVKVDTVSGIEANSKLQSSYTNVNGYSVDDLSVLGKFDIEAPLFNSYGSGNLPNGVVKYLYRLYTKYGHKSVWSNMTCNINLTDGLDNKTTGDFEDMKSNKSVIIEIPNNNANLGYTHIEVVRLWYSAVNTVPTATVIVSRMISTLPLMVVDVEYDSTFGSVDISEFNEVITFKKVKTMSILDNRLFLGNIKEHTFNVEFDARAYRFDSSGICKVYTEGGILSYTLDSSSPSWKATAGSIPITHDVINYTNDVSKDGTINRQDRDESGVFGATGVNVDITFTSFGGDDVDSGRFVGHMPDDIYRYAVVFEDDYGRRSPAKFICDLRMPTAHDRNSTNNIFPIIHIADTSETLGLRRYIVRAKRGEADRTIITQGVATSYRFNAHTSSYMTPANLDTVYGTANYGSHLENDGRYIRFISPEGVFFDLSKYTNMYLEFNRELSIVNASINNGTLTGDTSIILYKHEELYNNLAPIDYANRLRIEDSSLVKEGELVYIGGELINRITGKTFVTGSDYYISVCNNSKSTALYIEDGGVPIGFSNTIALCSIRSLILPYGGGSYSKRLNTVYIPASRISTSGSMTCIYGDVYNGDFNYYHSRWPYDPVDGDYFGVNVDEAVKAAGTVVLKNSYSTIDMNLRHDDVFNVDSSDSGLIQNSERGLAMVEEVLTFTYRGSTFFKERQVDYSPAFLYNSVYSNNSEVILSVELPDFIEDNSSDTMVRYSNSGLISEGWDSMLEFKANNFSQLNSGMGALNYMTPFNGSIYTFQDTSASKLLINPIIQTVGTDGTQVVLGTGSVIQDVQYVSDSIGIQKCNEVVKSVSFLYWIDLNKKKLYRLGQGVQSISDIKGVSSYFKSTLNKDSRFLGVYDNSRNSVLMTIVNDGLGTSYEDTTFTMISSYILSGDFTNIIMEEGLLYRLTTEALNGIYRLDTKYNTAGSFTYMSGDVIPPGSDVYMHKYLDLRDNYTIVFNEPVNIFTGFESFIPDLYLKTPQGFMTSSDSNLLYEHNKGDFGSYYGKVYPMMFEFVLNPGQPNAYYEALEIINEATINESKLTNKTGYEGLENITIDEVRGITNTQQAEYLDLKVKDATTDAEIIGDFVTDNIAQSNYSSSNRSILDSNGIMYANYPAYLYNVSKDLNQFKLPIPRNKTLMLDSDGRPINELLNGNYCKIRVVYNNSQNVKFKILSILTHYEPYTI